MPNLIWAVFCERAVVDSSTNNVSLLNVIEELHPAGPTPEQIKEAAGRVIGAAFPCVLVSNWERSDLDRPEITTVRLRLVDPRGKTVIEVRQALDLKKNARARLMANLPGMPVGLEGRYLWRFHVARGPAWKDAGSLPIYLKYVESERDISRLQREAREKAATAAKPVNVRNTAKR